MPERGYQHNFSRMVDGAMFNHRGRENKARTIVAVLRDYLTDTQTNSLVLLDVGASTGIIDSFLADQFSKVTGIDIDQEAIQFAQETFRKRNLDFRQGDVMALDLPENSYDAVICTHIYEHVPDAKQMIKEVFRVLKPGGICYFAAGNRISIMEPHYRLPLLSILPRPVAHLYMKISGKGNYYHEKHLTLKALKKLVRDFTVYDYTKKIINNPEKFSADYMLKPGSLKQGIAKFVANYFYWFCPTYIWILQKPKTHPS